jgi:hypothetical protein
MRPDTTTARLKGQGAPRPCEHLTFVTCPVCGLTYEQRQARKEQR